MKTTAALLSLVGLFYWGAAFSSPMAPADQEWALCQRALPLIGNNPGIDPWLKAACKDEQAAKSLHGHDDSFNWLKDLVAKAKKPAEQ